PEKEAEILGTAFVLRLAAGTIAMLLLCAIAFGTSEDPTTRLAILIVGFTLVFQPLDIAAYWFQAQVCSRPIVQARLAALAAVSLLRVVFILLDKPVLWFAWPVVLEIAVAGTLTFLCYLRSGPPVLRWRARLERARTMIGDAWPFALSAGLIDVQQRVDQLMLGALLGPAEVGWYAAAARVSQIWYFLPVAIATAVFPAIVQAKGTSKHIYKRHMQSLYDLTFWLAIVVVLPITAFSDVLVNALYGDAYAPAAHVLKIHVWTVLFVYTGTAASQWHFAENAAYLALSLASVRTLACVALNLLLIPPFGPAGAAWAMLLANAPVILLRFAYPRTRPTATMLFSAALAPVRHAGTLISRSRHA
ncbi:MAG: flippase, partial [Longimicrobiales bacterium]